jgi:DNA-binding CsgD family transcriptional regulator
MGTLTQSDFTNREYEILVLMADRASAKQIALQLFLSINTVNTHRKNILQKSKAPNTTALVVHLVRRGSL